MFSGIILNSCVASATLRLPDRYKKLKMCQKSNPLKKSAFNEAMEKIKGGLYALHDKRIVFFGFGISLAVCGYMNSLMLVPYAMLAHGYSYDETTASIASLGTSSTLTRIVILLCVDRKWFDNIKMYAFSGFIAGLSVVSELFNLNYYTPLI